VSEHLVKAAKTRHDTAAAKAEAALRELSTRGTPITFAAVARHAGISTDFLYRQPLLRSKITRMRNRTAATSAAERDGLDSTSAAVQALSARLKDLVTRHRGEIAALQRDLANAHGENLLLRRRLSAYEDLTP
jgi:hypothetical protein